jgi:hypothetical protein
MKIVAGLALGLLTVSALAACSGQTAPGGARGAPGPQDVAVGIGPIPLAAGEETTLCVVEPLGNADDAVLHGFDMHLAPGSHHLIVYLSDANEADTPFPCSPFTGVAVGNDVPIAFANTDDVTFAFPEGIAMDLPAGAMVKIEAHYINTTSAPLQGQGDVTLHTTPKSSTPAYRPANFLAFGTLHIDIPPNSTYSTGPIFQPALAGMNLVLVTTHQHRLGTGIKVWASSSAGDTSNQIADDTDWANPAWRMLPQPVAFDGTNGLTYQCDWTNTTNATVTFGESALDEMCIIAGYYYPSQGIYGCIDGHCRFR